VLGRSRAPCLSSGCFTANPPTVCRFPDSPRRTRRAAFTAPGSPGFGIPRPALPPGPYPVSSSPLSRQLHAESGLRLLRVASSLVPFALWPALPASDYYGTTDAAQVSLPDCWGHPFQGSLPRSRNRTLRGSLGGGFQAQPVRSLRLLTSSRVNRSTCCNLIRQQWLTGIGGSRKSVFLGHCPTGLSPTPGRTRVAGVALRHTFANPGVGRFSTRPTQDICVAGGEFPEGRIRFACTHHATSLSSLAS
jgi:hypothetical protein